MSRGLRAVLFDMDGVLIDSAAVANRLLAATAARHGVDLTPAELDSLAGCSGLHFWSYVKETYGLPGPVEEYRESYDSEAEVAAYNDDLIASGVRELIGELEASGVLIGLVTSASSWRTGQVVKLLDIASLVSAVVCSDDVVGHKPDPAPYLAAVTKLGVEPSECFAIEDSSRGVQSALAAGVPVLTFVGFGEDQEAVAQGLGTISDFAAESPASLQALHGSVRE